MSWVNITANLIFRLYNTTEPSQLDKANLGGGLDIQVVPKSSVVVLATFLNVPSCVDLMIGTWVKVVNKIYNVN